MNILFKKISFAIFVLLATLCISSSVSAQISESQILKILEETDIEVARKKLAEIAKKYPETPDILYLHALLIEDGEDARGNYEKLVKKFRSSKYAPHAFMRLGNYWYAKGDYKKARRFFLEVHRRYPNSDFSDEAHYLSAKMLLAQSDLKMAERELREVIESTKNPSVIILADEDLSYINLLNREIEQRQTTRAFFNNENVKENDSETQRTPEIFYGVQIGAFVQKKNAKNLAVYYKRLGFPAEILTFKNGSTVYYRVLIGRYESEHAARNFGGQFKKDYGINYRIVKLKAS